MLFYYVCDFIALLVLLSMEISIDNKTRKRNKYIELTLFLYVYVHYKHIHMHLKLVILNILKYFMVMRIFILIQCVWLIYMLNIYIKNKYIKFLCLQFQKPKLRYVTKYYKFV